MKVKNKEEKINKKLLVLLIIIMIIWIILQSIQGRKEASNQKNKIDPKKEYVITKYHSDSNQAVVPYINVKGVDVEIANDEITNLTQDYITSKDKNKTVTYRYNQYKNILSLVITFRDIDENDQLYYTYKTYVFDLDKEAKSLTEGEILEKFNISIPEINQKMESIMKEKYQEEAKKKIINQAECDYNCYIGLRKISNYTDEANYYIENGHLVVYRAFSVYSIYQEENYFTRDDFKFIIK